MQYSKNCKRILLNNMENYFVLGGSELQLDFIRTAKLNDLFVHVIDYDEGCVGASEADLFHCLSIDDLDGVLELARVYHPIGIHTVATEQGNITACYVAEQLGLSSNSYLTALCTTDKSRMKQVLNEHGLDTPVSRVVRTLEELKRMVIDYPVIVKASDRSAGRGVCLASTSEELMAAYKDALQQSFNKLVLIEEYFDAKQYSVETISGNGKHCILAVTQMGFSGPPDFVETEHHLPAKIPGSTAVDIADYVLKALEAFDIKVGACHIELRVDDKNTIKMIEIASRMGGWRHWMTKEALGIDYCQAILDATLGKELSVTRNVFGRVAISRHITCQDDYKIYLQEKKKGSHIVVDFVTQPRGEGKAKNLIDANGFYIVCEEG